MEKSEHQPLPTRARTLWLALSFVLAMTVILGFSQALIASESDVLAADLSGSSKTVDKAQATVGSILNYTIVVSNSGDQTAVGVLLTDTLPVSLTLAGMPSSSDSSPVFVSGNTITWTGAINQNAAITLTFGANITNTAAVGSVITNTVAISGAGSVLMHQAATEIISATAGGPHSLYLPVVIRTPPELLLVSSRPNSSNAWTLSWHGPISAATGVELQESNDENFSSVTTYNPSVDGTQPVEKPLSPNNVYYYRIRVLEGSTPGPWSNVVEVRGGYRDDFTDSSTGWAIRRTTLIEEVRTFYEIEPGKDWLVVQVEDSWDWGISSPLQKGPEPPYVIRYRSKIVNPGNLASAGGVFGGDWNETEVCPDYSSLEGVYQHDICFNQFYNVNTIWFGDLKVQFEKVNNLVWCPSCGGSPMKRDIDRIVTDRLSGVDESDWNNWRIEVRITGIDLFVNGNHYATFTDSSFIENPYFGLFASTDEYSNSTWRFEYFEVKPLDN